MKKIKKKTRSSIPRKHRMAEPVYRSEVPKKSGSNLYYFDKRYYFNLKSHRWKKHIDGDWDNGPIISRVPLYPEQAVLSCCTSVVSGALVRMINSANHACFTDQGGSGFPCQVTFGKAADCGFGTEPHQAQHIAYDSTAS